MNLLASQSWRTVKKGLIVTSRRFLPIQKEEKEGWTSLVCGLLRNRVSELERRRKKKKKAIEIEAV